jgi:hypothetical protein
VISALILKKLAITPKTMTMAPTNINATPPSTPNMKPLDVKPLKLLERFGSEGFVELNEELIEEVIEDSEGAYFMTDIAISPPPAPIIISPIIPQTMHQPNIAPEAFHALLHDTKCFTSTAFFLKD